MGFHKVNTSVPIFELSSLLKMMQLEVKGIDGKIVFDPGERKRSPRNDVLPKDGTCT